MLDQFGYVPAEDLEPLAAIVDRHSSEHWQRQVRRLRQLVRDYFGVELTPETSRHLVGVIEIARVYDSRFGANT